MTDTTTAPVTPVATAPVAPATPVEAPVIPGSPAPATPPVQEAPAAPAPAPDKSGKVEPYVYEKTGNANVDYALGIVGNAGISLDHPASQAALNGDFAQLRHLLADKGIAGHEALVSMLETAHKEGQEQDQANAKLIHEKVTSIFGTPEAWKEASDWAGKNATDDEKGVLNELLSDTKTAAIAAHYIRVMHEQSNAPREALAPATGPVVESSNPAPSNGGPLTRQQFAVEAAKLRAVHGENYINSAEYQALGRRLSGR